MMKKIKSFSIPTFLATLVIALAWLALAPTSRAQLVATTNTFGVTNVVTFTSGSGTWTVPNTVSAVDVLVVAGGGGGGGNGGGGGGAGGLIYSNSYAVVGGTGYTVTVGSGGGPAANGNGNSINGTNSVFATLTAIGGGGGGSRDQYSAGKTGGSGGGAGGSDTIQTAASGTASQGNSGGVNTNGGINAAGGGGGGAGAVGGNATSASSGTGGNGGVGVANSITFSSVVYGGGGGGGCVGGGRPFGTGGSGGGGNGASNGAGSPGTANTGGGGGGGGTGGASGATGGSGVVIVRYVAFADTNAPTPNPLTWYLPPQAQTATSIYMVATTASDVTPPVQYFFTNTVNGHTSGWTNSTAWTDTGLTTGATYTYEVEARDSSPATNVGTWSAPASAKAQADSTAPTVTTWADSTGTETSLPYTVITYTLTFSKAINPATVTAGAFGNTGTATATIGAIAQTATNVFTVQVTPTTVGSLILGINASTITDWPGNSVAAVSDPTTVAVVVTTLTWDPSANGHSDGAGTWDSGSFWYTGSADTTWTSGDAALFGNGGAGGAVTLAGPTTVSSLTLSNFTGTYTLGTAGNTITLYSGLTARSATTTILSPIKLGGNQTWTNSSGHTLTLSGGLNASSNALTIGSSATTYLNGVFSGSGNITNTGSGTFQSPSGGGLGTYDYTGNLTVNNGTVWLIFGAGFQTGSTTNNIGNVTVNAPGKFVTDEARLTNNPGCTMTLNGGGSTTQGGWADTDGYGGIWNGPIYLQTTSPLGAGGGQQMTVNGVISGPGGLIINNGGHNVILNSNNTYTGATTISSGSLVLGANGSISNTPSISIAAGCTFDVSAVASPYIWGTNTLTAAGTASASTINGASGGTINLGSQPIVLNYDGTHVPLTVSQGALSLNANSFTVNGSTLLPGTYTIVSQTTGTITTSGTFPGVGGTAIPAGKVGYVTTSGTTPGNVVLNVGAPTLTVSGFPSPQTAGVAGSVTVTAKDANGNPATAYNGTVHFTSTDGAAVLPADYTFLPADNGTHTFSATLETAGIQSITATDSVAGVNGAQTGISVTPAGAATLTVSGFPNPVTAGASGSVTVTAKDAYGNTATGYAGTIHFTSTDGAASLPANYTFLGGDHGSHTFTATLNTVGSGVSITATDTVTGTITGTESGITVNSATVASYLMVSGLSSPRTAGNNGSVTVTAKLVNGTTATGYTNTIHFTSSDPLAVLPADYTFTAGNNGTHTFVGGVNLKTAGAQSVTATDTTTSITGQTNAIVTPASAASLTVTGFPSPQFAGTAGGVTVTAKDAYGNIATNYTGTITFTSSDVSASLPVNYTFVTGDAGVHTFVAGVTFATAGTQTITATDTVTGSINGTQSGITINPIPVAFYWTNTVSDTWGVGNNWTNNSGVSGQAPVVGGAADYGLNFNQASTNTVTANLGNNFLLNQLEFGGATVTLAGESLALTNNGLILPAITQNSAKSVTVGNDLVLGTNTTLGGSGAGTVTLTGWVSGPGSLTKTNSGTLAIGSVVADTYSGGTIINSGTLRVTAPVYSPLGSGPIVFNSGASFNPGSTRLYNDITFNGTPVTDGDGFGLVLYGPVHLTNTITYDIGVAGSGTIYGNMDGLGSLIKLGVSPNALLLAGTNTYTGTNFVNVGVLQFNGSNAVGAASLSISSGAIVRLNYAGDRVIPALILNGVSQAAGTYGSATSPATYTNAFFATNYNGTVTVVASATATPPVWSVFGPLSGTSFPLSFSGTPGSSYTVLTSTNLTVPLTNWTVLGTGSFTDTNAVTYTDTNATTVQQFYIIKSY